MNILKFSWRGPGHPNFGGAEIASHEHSKAWVKQGHKVVLYTSSYKGAKKREYIDGVEVIRDGWQIFGVHVKAFLWYFFADHPKFDIVVDEIHGIPFFTPLYVSSKRLVYIHEVAKEVWSLNPWPMPFKLIPTFIGGLLEPLTFVCFYRNENFMTVSESTKKDLIDWGVNPRKITIIYNGVNLIKIKNSRKKSKIAVYLGAIAKDKGIEDALKTFSKMSDIEPGWKFWVIGKCGEDYMMHIRRLVEDLKLNSKVKFWGFVSDQKKFSLLAKCSVLINPSVREGWGLVNIEANSVFTPVVAYDVPGIRDSVQNEKTGILVEKVMGSDALASAAMKLVNDKRKYKRFQQSAKKWSEKFAWKNATQSSSMLLNRLLH